MITKIKDFKALNENHYLVVAKDKQHLRMLIEKNIEKFGPNCNLNYIDTSNITDMSSLFNNDDSNSNVNKFNGDISKWNTSNVENMSYMFRYSKFNQDISNWDTSKVRNMEYMFDMSKFDQDISNWDVSNVKNMSWMFWRSKFNQDISNWDTSKVEVMNGMFKKSKFNQNIDNWNVDSNITKTITMFDYSPLEANPPAWYNK